MKRKYAIGVNKKKDARKGIIADEDLAMAPPPSIKKGMKDRILSKKSITLFCGQSKPL